mgnify:FL=1
MAPIGTVVALGLMSGCGFVVYSKLPQQTPGDIPWKDIAGGGSAVLMFAAIVVFLRFLVTERQARDAMLMAEREARAKERDADRALHKDLATTHANTIERMGETQMTLMRELVAQKR